MSNDGVQIIIKMMRARISATSSVKTVMKYIYIYILIYKYIRICAKIGARAALQDHPNMFFMDSKFALGLSTVSAWWIPVDTWAIDSSTGMKRI